MAHIDEFVEPFFQQLAEHSAWTARHCINMQNMYHELHGQLLEECGFGATDRITNGFLIRYHDIGKLAIPDSQLNSTEPFDPTDVMDSQSKIRILSEHSERGADFF